MFGFIRPVKSELKVKEADRFQQVYCGLCHAIRARYGRFYTMFLSYDMTFYALVVGSGEVSVPPAERRRCDAHPLTKRACAAPDDALALAADASVLLSYHKFRDNLEDEKGAKRLLAALLCRTARLRKGAGTSARGRQRTSRSARRSARVRERTMHLDGPRGGRFRPHDGGGRAAHRRHARACAPADVLPHRQMALSARCGAGPQRRHEIGQLQPRGATDWTSLI